MADLCSGDLCRRSVSGWGIDPADHCSQFGFVLPANGHLGGKIVLGRAWSRLERRLYLTLSLMFFPAVN